ncbi:Tetraspanin-8 [Ophiophagus hannah]|uniref:Tetraspanin-8 n=1 Tax=Ophiophagus hannah TaxID=8665 RepID=V8NE18_OPHHA|nr:Tetraspanin-8 [Ophiophagus hannah]
MAGVSSCMKYSMFIFNFLFWIIGCFILGASIWIRVSKDIQEEFKTESSMFSPVNLLIAVGSVIMVLGFLGCCGAMKESQCMLLLYKCCGLLNGKTDWGENLLSNHGCECDQTDIGTSDCVKNQYVKTCATVITEIFKKNMVIVMGIAFGLAFIEIVGMVFSMSLYCQIQKK